MRGSGLTKLADFLFMLAIKDASSHLPVLAHIPAEAVIVNSYSSRNGCPKKPLSVSCFHHDILSQ